MKQRINISIRGAVQGVGFRPFVYRLARSLQLHGWVLNSTNGVSIEAEGPTAQLHEFVLRIEREKPEPAIIQSLEFSYLDPAGHSDFVILHSREESTISAFILPDIAVCRDCLREMRDSTDRRYLYPFINCTHCGPRFSIIESLPYDRPNTSMKSFPMCEDCRREYRNPEDRRFHAQPIACPECGPHLTLWDAQGNTVSLKHQALLDAADMIRQGKILALKGLGGFHLMVDACSKEAVQRLRMRKHREEKPFALMFPNLNSVKNACLISDFEERLLQSPESPIVLLHRRQQDPGGIYRGVAPSNPTLGVMLPYTPLHHLLMQELDFPVVATSGNISEEPMSTDEMAALRKLAGIVDFYLVHNRPIVRHVDDSIVRVIMGREMVLRRARGYAPLPLPAGVGTIDRKPVLAVGAHLKNSVALGVGNQIFISQHIGDLATDEAYRTFEQVIGDFQKLYQAEPGQVVSDLHPDYLSTKFAGANFPEVIQVQHHEAHVAACRLENQVDGPALGVSWDGTGLGSDGSIWGGEFFATDDTGMQHIGKFLEFPLPGADEAVREPRRSALGMLFALQGERFFETDTTIRPHFSSSEWSLLGQMLIKNVNCPRTSSVGRIFDAIASLLGLRQQIGFEGQAAMMLEFLAEQKEIRSYPWEITGHSPFIVDWRPMMTGILEDLRTGTPAGRIAMKFHRTLGRIILAVAGHTGLKKVIMSGGCFQNAVLLELAVKLLQAEGLQPYWHQRIPPNDGGISLGQIALIRQERNKADKLSRNAAKTIIK